MPLRLSMLLNLSLAGCLIQPVEPPDLPNPPQRPLQPILVGGSGACLPVARFLVRQMNREDVRVLPSIGSAGAVRAVNAGRIDLG